MAEPNLTPESESERPHLRHPILDWSASLGLLALFIAALIYFPPVSSSKNPPSVSEWMLFFGRFHPIFVHLPIGVMIMAIVMEIISMTKHRVANALRPAVTFILWCGVFGLITAVTFGILLSREGGFDATTIQAHQTLGIAATIVAFLALFAKLLADGTGRGTFLYRLFLTLSFLILSVGAHFGGNMSHGDNYLTEHAPKVIRDSVKKYEDMVLAQFTVQPSSEDPTAKPRIIPAPVNPGSVKKTVFVALVSPILEKKCNSCHNATKSKGGLRMQTYELLIKGGDNGDTVVPGDPDKSLLVSRLTLPKEDDDHMPPSGKEAISPEEISLLTWWIKNGASKTMTVAEAEPKLPAELHSLEQTLLTKGTVKSGTTGSTPPHLLIASAAAAAQANPAVAEAMKKINGSGASLAPLGADPTQLRFTALNVARDYTDENLKDLTPILENIVALDLAKTKVTDESISLISKMPNLRELHLENTAVTDAGLAQLKVLAKLEYLNLYGTKVTDKALDIVGEIASLKSLYLWQTGVTKPKADAFKAAHPAINLNIGWNDADAAKVVATAPAPAPKPEAKPVAPAPAATVAAATAPAVAAAAAAKPTEAPKPVAAAPANPQAAVPNPQSPTPGKPLDPNAVVFKDVVMPILEEKCIACHGAKKSKGKLRMDSYAALLKGGSDGADTIIPSKPADSLMVKRTALPVDDDDHMPPKDEKQLTKDEIALLKWWVETGANETATLASLEKTPEVDAALTAFAAAPHAKGAAGDTVSKGSEKPKAKPLTPEEKKTVAEVTAKMTALNASLMPLALDTELLRFSCVNGADKISDKELALLEPAAAWIVWMDLGKTKVTDAGLASIAKMKNLEKLHLEKTAVTDAGLASLAGLPHLEYLNLYGTKITDAGIAKLAPDKGLKKLFVWETAVTHDGAKKLEGAVPGLVVNVGLSEADIAKLIEQNKPPEPPPAPAAAKKATAPAAKPATPAPATKPAAPAPAPAKPAATTPPPAPAPAAKPAAQTAAPKPDDKK